MYDTWPINPNLKKKKKKNLNISVSHVTNVCQDIHSVSHAARTNDQQMNLAAKLHGHDRLCEEFLGRFQNQLLSIGRDRHQGDGYTTFNVLQSPKYQHVVHEKGDRELVMAEHIPPPVISANPPPPSSSPILQSSTSQRICSRLKLKAEEPMEDLVRICMSWYVLFTQTAPAITRTVQWQGITPFSFPEILPKAYKEMQESKPVGGVRWVRSLEDAFRFAKFPLYEGSYTRSQRKTSETRNQELPIHKWERLPVADAIGIFLVLSHNLRRWYYRWPAK